MAAVRMFGGIECTEDEPDDDFRPGVVDPAAADESGGRLEVAEAAAQQQAAEPAAQPPEGGAAAAGGEPGAAGAEAEAARAPPGQGGEGDGEGEPSQAERPRQLEGTAAPTAAGGRRVLAWNDQGQVVVHAEQNRVEVRREGRGEPQRFPPFEGLEMAAVSAGCCCLGAGAGSAAPRLVLRPAEAWEKESFAVPLGGPDEAPEAVACGEDFAAALTSKRLLRVYSANGLPMGLASVPGRAVGLAARGQLLLVVTRPAGSGLAPGAPCEEDEALDFRLIDVRGLAQRAVGRVPLSAGSRLCWLGFTPSLAPVAVDSRGVARVFFFCAGLAGSGDWVPVLSLPDEEARLGALRVVGARDRGLLCAQTEPGKLGALRELPWTLPLGAMPAAGGAVQDALLAGLLSRHARVVAGFAAAVPAARDMREADATDPGAAEAEFKMKSLRLFGQLVTADEVERALDVARGAAAGGADAPKLLGMMQQFAERAGSHKLADLVAGLPRGAAPPPRPPPAVVGGFFAEGAGAGGGRRRPAPPATPLGRGALGAPAAELAEPPRKVGRAAAA